jgi:hypothetical protein
MWYFTDPLLLSSLSALTDALSVNSQLQEVHIGILSFLSGLLSSWIFVSGMKF